MLTPRLHSGGWYNPIKDSAKGFCGAETGKDKKCDNRKLFSYGFQGWQSKGQKSSKVAERVSVKLKPQLPTGWDYYNPSIGVAVHILYTPA